jgi:hypothetical protein
VIINPSRARGLLAVFDLSCLFIEEMGWDRIQGALEIRQGDDEICLTAIAQKRGMVAYHYSIAAGQSFPDRSTRMKIERQVAKSTFEHLIIFTDSTKGTQIWQWVKREPGRPASCREHTYRIGQPGDALIQKLEALAFTLQEEEQLTLTDVTRRAGKGFDVERVTKRFYERFQKELAAFLGLIDGIEEFSDREWYASLILNRLMFVYFIQRKGFLDGDRDYLRNRLARTQAEFGKDRFFSFYRHFLLRLFHEGLGARNRTPDLDKLIGCVPYLNGGLFDIHELEKPERYGRTIQIPDCAFVSIFDYFDQYQWNLDERPLRADNEINPDVLGYIFEKYINQKQMGAYYTKEDITEYISKNTVLPFIVDSAHGKCKVAFDNPDGPTVWDLLKDDPDRYIYQAVQHGVNEPVPDNIAVGLNPPTLHQPVGDGPVLTLELRKDWNRNAPDTHALPTETWRELIARRQRYHEVKEKLSSGSVHDANDLITLNLDFRQFVQDAIETCEGPDLLRAFWHSIESITVLDPTCGSGAFLFAALNILEPLYKACLERMEAFIEDLEQSGEKHRPEKYSDFRKVLAHVTAHPNREFFIFKSIILNNLYGVDIMEEAVEICKLRLFLKLAAQVEPDPAKPNLGIEPLPDIDFNIRNGNTLVGFATLDEVKSALSSKLDFSEAAEKIGTKAADLQQAFDTFRARQVEGDGSVPISDKSELQKRLKALETELNGYLASEYGIGPSSESAYGLWLRSHQPFHWFLEFYGIMESGGFDAVIGNPPYIVYSKGKIDYALDEGAFAAIGAKNLYAFVLERSMKLAGPRAPIGMIVPMTLLSSERMSTLQDLLWHRGRLFSPAFPRRPESIFDGVEMPVAIVLSLPADREARNSAQSSEPVFVTSRVGRIYTEERAYAFSAIKLLKHSIRLEACRIAKIGEFLEQQILGKLMNGSRRPLGALAVGRSRWVVYYQEACRYWAKACQGLPFFTRNGQKIEPPHGRIVTLESQAASSLVECLMNSSLFYWYYSILSDCEHINDALVRAFPIPTQWQKSNWMELSRRLSESLRTSARRKVITTKEGYVIEYDEMKAACSKRVIDAIDCALSREYELTEEELDAITNYDIKYRMGSETEGEEE